MGSSNPQDLGNGGEISGDLTVTGSLNVGGSIGLTLSEVIQGTSTIDVNSTEALVIRKDGDAGDVMVVDTTNEQVKVGDNFIVNASGTTPVLTITGTRNDILFTESDTTNLNTLVRHQTGLLRIDTINDALDTSQIRFTIDHSNGNVSIGSAEDSSKFLQFKRGGSGSGVVRGSIGTNNSKLTFIGGSGTSSHMTLDSSGNFGINKTSPEEKLHVAGNVKLFESGNTADKTYSSTGAGLFLTSYQSDSGSPYTKTSDIVAGSDGTVPSEIRFFTRTSGSSSLTKALILESNQNASFSEDVTVGAEVGSGEFAKLAFKANTSASGRYANITKEYDSPFTFQIEASSSATTAPIVFKNSNAQTALTLSSSADATFAGDVILSKTTNSAIYQDDSSEFLRLGVGGSGNDTPRIEIFGKDYGGSNAGGNIYIVSGGDGSATSGDILLGADQGAFAEHMRITNSGDIGIGLNNPGDYYATQLVVSAPDNGGMTFVSGNTGHASGIFFADGTTGSGDSAYRGQMVYDHNNDSFGIWTAGTNAIKIDSSQNFGIGENDPDKKLHIKSSTSADGIVIENTSTGSTQIRFEADSSTFRGLIGIDDSDGNAFLSSTASKAYVMCLRSEGEMHFGVNGNNTRFILDENSRISLSNNDSGTSNTIFGRTAGDAIVSGGNNNTLFGFNAGNSITTGDGNVLLGYRAGETFDTNGNNIGIGSQALGGNGNASKCIAIGTSALIGSLSSASDGSVAIGHQALTALTSGANNLAIGFEALKGHTTGNRNIAIGNGAMDGNGGATVNNSNDNTFLGFDAGGGTWTTAVCQYNVGIGNYSLDGAMNGANLNTAVGYGSLSSLTEGDSNVAVGSSALADNTSARYNTSIGASSLQRNVNGEHNVAIGLSAGKFSAAGAGNATSPDQCVIIGSNSEFSSTAPTNQIVIGFNADGLADNSVTLGNADVTDVYMAQDGEATIHCAGIQFPASQVANGGANVLDDYEEGEHTATVVGATSGNFVVNSTFNKFRYTKIGRIVHIQGLIITDSDNSTSGSLRISLPFTIGDGSGGSERSFGSVALQAHGGTISGNLNAVLEPGNAFFEIIETQDSGATNTISESDVDSAFNIGVDFTYTV